MDEKKKALQYLFIQTNATEHDHEKDEVSLTYETIATIMAQYKNYGNTPTEKLIYCDCEVGKCEGKEFNRCAFKHGKPKMEIEEWKEINVAKAYEVSNLGRVRHEKTKVIKNLNTRSNGYVWVTLWVDGKTKSFSLHRLVMMAFEFNSEHKNLFVDHIDFDPSNNKLSNLRWITPKGNYDHSNENGRFDARNKNICVPVYCYDKETKLFIDSYEAVKDAAKSVSCTSRAIRYAAKTGGNCKGFKWSYTKKEKL